VKPRIKINAGTIIIPPPKPNDPPTIPAKKPITISKIISFILIIMFLKI
jgi:hypothetical protein